MDVRMASSYCSYCNASIQPGVEICASCGAYQYAVQLETPLPYLQYSSPIQPPTGLGSPSIQSLPGQQALYAQPLLTSLPVKPRTSGFAITSLILGIVAILLALFDILLDGGAALEVSHTSTDLIFVLILALFCWTPAVIALIFGFQAKRKIQRDDGAKGMGLAYTGITLGSISLVLPLLGVILFSLSLLP